MSDSVHLEGAGNEPQRPASRQRPAFASFFERDALRQRRRSSRRRTLVISLAVHLVALVVLVVLSFWQVDELWSPGVEVKVYSRKTLPPGTPVELVAPPPSLPQPALPPPTPTKRGP